MKHILIRSLATLLSLASASLLYGQTKPGDLLPDLAKFAAIPAGDFQMGDALDGMKNAPVHTVNLTAYHMQKKGVTKAEWDAVRAWGLTHGYTDLAAGAGKAADHPVQTISWYDAVKWCNARSEQEGLTPCYYTDAAQTAVFRTGTNNIGNTMVKWNANGYRLPTEAEREKAARGGLNGKRFPWGDKISHSAVPTDPEVGLANYFAQPGRYPYDVSPTSGYHPSHTAGGQPYTSPVGSFPANAYGIFDMAGNVWEWCWDWYGDAYYTVSPGSDPPGPASGSSRVLRGGYWYNNSSFCRVAFRPLTSPGNTNYNIGFRPVRR
jgi:formylglycine-generating enzyme required for sulfatase activity